MTLTGPVASESRATTGWSRRRGWVTAALAVVLVTFVVVNVWPGRQAGPTVHLFVHSYRPGPGPDQITVWYVFGNCDIFRRVSVVQQTPTRVVVAATARAGGCPGVGAYEAVAHLQSVTLTLDAPLGKRWVAADDGQTLHSVPTFPGVSAR